jgi:hypothetical protein
VLSDLPPDVDAFGGTEVIVGLPSSTATCIGSQILRNFVQSTRETQYCCSSAASAGATELNPMNDLAVDDCPTWQGIAEAISAVANGLEGGRPRITPDPRDTVLVDICSRQRALFGGGVTAWRE